MTETTASQSPRVYKVMLMILPVGCVIGTIIFMFMYFYNEREDERNHAVIASHGLRVTDLEDMVDKFTDRIGERNVDTEQGRVGLRRAASMIEGRLGPQNVGYPVAKCTGEAAYGLLWKSVSVEIRGREQPDDVVFVAASYSGPGGVADANAVSTAMVLAISMAREKPAKTLRFVFLPLDKGAAEQKRWLIKHNLKGGERCAGIIGIKTMQGIPETGASEWQVETPSASDENWWKKLTAGHTTIQTGVSDAPAIWLTHTVFSDQTWIGNKPGRLQATLQAARDIRNWLLIAAGKTS